MTPVETALRRAVLVAVLSGEVAAWTAGVLPLPLLLGALAVTVVAARIAARTPPARVEAQRRIATGAVLIMALAAVPQVPGGGGEAGLRGLLGPLLVGIVAVQALTWLSLRDLRTGVGAAAGLLVLGASFAPDVLVGLPLLVGWAAVLAAVVLGARAQVAQDADVVLVADDRRTGLLAVTALAAILGLVAFLLVPVPEDAGLASRLAQAAQNANSGRGAPGAYTGDRVDLHVRGELSDEPVIDVPADSPPLWRSGVYPTWDGRAWTTAAAERRVAGPPFVIAEATGPVRTDDVVVRRRAGGPVWSPGPVVSVALQGRAVAVDEHGAVRGFTAPAYRVRSQVVLPTVDELRASTGPDVDDPQWTALPASLPERVTTLGRELTAGAASRIDAVRAVEQWLAQNARYSLDSPVPGPGEDAVDRFLFVDRVGFCEQFAAAEVLLLRAAGIPARFATGLAYGTEGERGIRTYRQKDLHAWVEVFHPGTGWVASDPTPPSTQLASASLRVRLVAQLSTALRRADDVPGGRPVLAAGLLVLTALVAVGLRRRRPAAVAARAAVTPVDVTGRPALQAFLRWDAAQGPRRRRPAESLGELRARPDLPEQVRSALEVVEQECYAPAAPSPDAAVAVLDGR